jgi:hypothetical protein
LRQLRSQAQRCGNPICARSPSHHDDQRRDAGHLVLRRDLVAQRAAHKQRLTAPAGAAIHVHLDPLLRQFDCSIAELDDAIAALVARIDSLRLRVDTITAIKGCGTVVAACSVKVTFPPPVVAARTVHVPARMPRPGGSPPT